MRSREFEEAVRPSRFVMTVMWGALLASVGIYVMVAYLATPAAEDVSELPEGLALGLTVAALGAAAASFLLPSRLLSDARLREHMQSENFDLARYAKNPQTGQVDQARVEKLEKLPDVEQRLVTASALFFTPWVIGVALAESVAVFGLVLAFLTGKPDAMLPFAAAAAVIIVIKRPNFERMFLRLERYAK